MTNTLRRYQERLTEVSKASPSIFLSTISDKNQFDAHRLMSVDPELPFKILTEKTVSLLPVHPQDEEGVLLSGSLKTLFKEVESIEKETGRNTFYIAYGLLEGEIAPKEMYRAPLLFIPGRLRKIRSGRIDSWVVERVEDEKPFVNRALTVALRHYRKIDLEMLPEEVFEEQAERLLPTLLSGLRELSLEATLHTEELVEPFEKVLKRDAAKLVPAALRIRPFLILGKFQQSSNSLLKDYDQMIKKPPTSGLFATLTGLVDSPSEGSNDVSEVKKEELNRYSAEETHFVLDTDASQEAAVIASRERQGLIVQGPPGTGKSQVIINLIADRLMHDQKVLVVCQKPVALQVLYSRLGSIGVSRHAALVAKPAEDRQKMMEKLLSVLDQEEPSELPTPSASLSREIDRLKNKLDAIASALHQKRPCGHTLRNLYTMTNNRLDGFFDVSDLRVVQTEEDLEAEVRAIEEIAKLAAKHDRSESPWFMRNSFVAAGSEHEIRSLLSSLLRLREDLGEPVSPRLYERSEWVARLDSQLEILSDDRTLSEVASLQQQFDDLNQLPRIQRALNMAKQLVQPHVKTMFMVDESDERLLLEWKKAAEWMDRHGGSWLSYLNPFRKRRQRLVEHAMLVSSASSARELAQATSSRLALLQAHKQVVQTGLDSMSLDQLDAQTAYDRILKMTACLEFLVAYRRAAVEVPECFPALDSSSDASSLIKASVRTGMVVEEAKRRIPDLQRIMRNAESFLKECLTEPDGADRMRSLLNSLTLFEEIKRLDQLKESATPLTMSLLQRCEASVPIESEQFAPDAWRDLVRNSFRLRWIAEAELEDSHVLDVSQDVYEEMRKSFQELLEKKKQETPIVLQGRLAGKSSSIDPKRKHSLKHEAGKKGRSRGKKTLRQLIHDYPDELFRLFPVWLCTPDAVSSLFPLQGEMFDLVIFDEASQLAVENSLPAIYRGKQIIVAGDEMQLPPADYFKVTLEDDGEDEDPLFKNEDDRFAKSLLEWCKPKMADVWLTCHYRSEHDALINFSNQAFYSGRMDTARPAKTANESPLRFIKVDGRWMGGINRKEAERVASLALEILRDDPSNPTIGIIAMNDAQAKLIDSLLDSLSTADPEAQHLIETARNRKNGDEDVELFVKNIENVQGDERDVILFSATYGEDEHGKMPLVFGKLSSETGGNILNVAVTRAKKRMIVACSFEPAEWHKAETYKKGVRFYKRYLEYARAVSEGDGRRMNDILNGLGRATSVQDLDDNVSYDSPFEQQVREAILSLGYDVHTQVGYSGYRIDLGVKSKVDPSRYVLGVECDGAMYHSSKVARERDYYRQRFLEDKGWKIHRIWSRNWWKNSEVEVAKLEELLTSLESAIQHEAESAKSAI